MGNAAVSLRRWLPPDDEEDLRGLVALVTGAGGAVGREAALLLASGGCHVVCVDLHHSLAEDTVNLIHKQHGEGSASSEVCDVSSRPQLLETAARVLRQRGPVHLLVDADADASATALETHFWVVLAFLPGMLSRGRGHVVCVSEHRAVAGLLEAFRQELRLRQHGHVTLSYVGQTLRLPEEAALDAVTRIRRDVHRHGTSAHCKALSTNKDTL